MICPKCGESAAHRSHRSSIKDRFYRVFQMIPYRCHKCSARFYAFRAGATSSKLRTREERKVIELRRKLQWRRSKGQLVAYAAAALLLVALLYLILRQTVPSD